MVDKVVKPDRVVPTCKSVQGRQRQRQKHCSEFGLATIMDSSPTGTAKWGAVQNVNATKTDLMRLEQVLKSLTDMPQPENVSAVPCAPA